jgi:hypothetical protein
VLKFVEWNWSVPKLSSRSRDNLPNPQQPVGTYVPINGPLSGISGIFSTFSVSAQMRRKSLPRFPITTKTIRLDLVLR